MRFQKIDDLTRDQHSYLTEDDICFFYGSYIRRAKYDYDDFHSLFWNFKKSLDKPYQQYKHKAIRRIGVMIAKALADAPAETLYFPIPPSIAKGQPGYDDRCLQALEHARTVSSGRMIVSDMVRQVESMEPAHRSDVRPSPEDYLANYRVNDPTALGAAKDIVVFDDLITTGSHFRAVHSLVRTYNPHAQIVGLFLGRRAIEPEPEDDELPF